MYTNKKFFRNVGIVCVGVAFMIMTLLTSTHVSAQEFPPVIENGTCLNCHENLYFQYDTGNWFCIRESPMQCVDCHDGNPDALTQADAHADRKAHPIINDDISKCQGCHLDECLDRVEKFDQVAGISDVLVSAPYQPNSISQEEPFPVSVSKQLLHPAWLFSLILLTVWAVIYFAQKI